MYTGSNVYRRTSGTLSALEKMGSEHNASTAKGSAMRDQLSTIHDPSWNLSFMGPPTGFHAASFDTRPQFNPVRGPGSAF
jgi:hypothetical protein